MLKLDWLILLRFDLNVSAATLKLKPETLAAWDVYLQAANDKMQARLQPGATFLWIDEDPDRAERIRGKGPYIAPMVRGHSKEGSIGPDSRLARRRFCPQCENRRYFASGAGL